MNNKDYICNHCGIILHEEDLIDNEDGLCPLCLMPLEALQTENYTPIINNPVNSSHVSDKIQYIKMVGQKDVWSRIEKLACPFERIEERKAFFEALKILKLEFNIGENLK
jgi:hypothetical protein